MYRKIGSSESRGETSPNGDLKGAPNRRSAVGELSSLISHLVCWEMSSRFKSKTNISAVVSGTLGYITCSVLASQLGHRPGGCRRWICTQHFALAQYQPEP